MRFRTSILIKVIAFSAVCLVFTGILGIRLANHGLFTHEKVYEAEFNNASGVVKGDSVKIAGVDVGAVKGFHIEDGKAVVEFSVKDSVEIPDDSMAAIRWRNVLGQRFLYVYPGISDTTLAEHGRIPVARTQEAGDIGELLNNLGPILQAINPDKANAFLDSVNTALVGNEVAARQLIDNTAGLSTELAGVQDEIASMVDSSDKVLGAFASQDDALGEILGHLNEVGGALRSTTGDINTVVTDFSIVQKQLNQLLVDNRDNIDSTLIDLSSVSKTLANNKDQLAETLCTLPLGLSGYFQTTSFGEWFNVRVVEVLIKDKDNKTLVQQREDETSRGDSAPPAYIDCGKKSKYTAPVGAPSNDKTPQNQPTVGLEGILRFALQRGTDA